MQVKRGNADEITFRAQGVEAGVDLAVGHLTHLSVTHDGRTVGPLHRAPWAGDPDGSFPEGTPPNVRRLSGDFLCAPFGRNDIEAAPSHGWPANSRWSVVEDAATADGWRVRLRLDRTVFGATVEKILTLRGGHPFLYQEHVFIGGEGGVPVAHHTMVRVKAGAMLAFSPKRIAETLDSPLEPDPARGRFALAYPARTADLARFPLAGGGETDLHLFPLTYRHEDFLTLAEAGHGGLGWTLVTRSDERDIILVLKNGADLPVTMLWMSNGGRDYAPWSGRHSGVLGIEDGRASGLGHKGSTAENSLTRAGIPTALALRPDGAVSFRQVIGALPLDRMIASAKSVTPDGGRLVVAMSDGSEIDAPFDSDFLAQPLI